MDGGAQCLESEPSARTVLLITHTTEKAECDRLEAPEDCCPEGFDYLGLNLDEAVCLEVLDDDG